MAEKSISTDAFDNGGVKEDLHNEFKTSIFVDAESQLPGVKQMVKIARAMAAFMNTEGGMLYVGVTDLGQVRGIGGDLAILANSPESVAVHTVRYNDDGFTYGATEDKYELKIRAIARAWLGSNAGACIKSVLVRPIDGKPVCRIKVDRCNPEEIVYFFQKNPKLKTEEEQIVIRNGNQNKTLVGAERDAFVRKRVLAGLDAQIKAVRNVASDTGSGDFKALTAAVETLLEKLEVEKRIGPEISVSGGQPFTKEAIEATKRPKSLAWEGCHYAEVSGWQELVLKVLEKLQELDAAKFNELADRREFSRTLVKVSKPREKHPDCFAGRFGAEGRIRVKKSIGNKVYLWNEGLFLRKFVAACGVDIGKFMFVPA